MMMIDTDASRAHPSDARLPKTKPDRVKVWDIAVRFFHWSLVLTFLIAWVSADEWDKVHEISGYFIGGLVGFRIVWGLGGSKYARFGNFIYKPATVLQYLRDSRSFRTKRYIGHNPAGGAMVIALLLSLIGVTVTGIAMVEPLYWGGEWMEELHEVAANIILVLIGLHIVGILFASFEHNENLVRSMINGFKRPSDD